MPPLRSLAGLLEHVRGVALPEGVPAALPITGIAYDSARVRPGELFVALRGARADGHDFVAIAARRGAAAAVVERTPADGGGLPLVRVPDGRGALAELAAAWHRHPAERLRMLGITGTVGKSSVLCMLEAIWGAAGRPLGSVGSLGVRISGEGEETGFTVPDPLVLHGSLARFVDAGCRTAAMEVTTHALEQGRVHGLRYGLGVFTNLLPGEHADYHHSFRSYAGSKIRFFEHLRPGAPLAYAADDRAARALAQGRRDLHPIGCGTDASAEVRIEGLAVGAEGARFRLSVRRPLPRLAGDPVPRQEIPIRLRLPGRPHARNAALAAAAALCSGVGPDAVRRGLEALTPPRRRMETLHRGSFTVLDDTAYHPDSISALWEVVGRLAPRRLHVAYAVRGQRGTVANRRAAEALAIWAARSPLANLIVTRAEGAVEARDRVTPEERAAFVGPLFRAGLPVEEHARLDTAVTAALERAGEGDVVLLLGAHGMNGAAAVARAWLASAARSASPDATASPSPALQRRPA